jgi:gluconolactonase
MSDYVVERRKLLVSLSAGAFLGSVPRWSCGQTAATGAIPKVSTVAAKDVWIIGKGVMGPEGPAVLPDDSIAMVAFMAGNIVRVHRDGTKEVLAVLGSGVAGTVLGQDGALYVAKLNTDSFMRGMRGGSAPAGNLPPATPSAIVRIDLNTKQTRTLYTELDGKEIPGPNDLVIDSWGDIWFSDPASASVCNCRTDGRLIKRVIDDVKGVNGITLSPDKRTVYVKGGAQLLSFKISARGAVALANGKAARRVIAEWPGKYHEPDGMKTEASGNILCACWEDGIVRISPKGEVLSQTIVPGLNVINMAFSPRERNALYLAAHPANDRNGGPVRIPWDAKGIA